MIKIMYYVCHIVLIFAFCFSVYGIIRVWGSKRFVPVEAEIGSFKIGAGVPGKTGFRKDVPIYVSYRYRFGGKDYQSDRVEVVTRGWNFGSWRRYVPSTADLSKLFEVVFNPSEEEKSRLVKIGYPQSAECSDQYVRKKIIAYVNPKCPQEAFVVKTSPWVYVRGMIFSLFFLGGIHLFRSVLHAGQTGVR
jgi:hypothetical protein